MPSQVATRAILFCDVVGSTAMRQKIGDAAADRWMAQLMSMIDSVVRRGDGVVIKSLGDGAMAAFTSASDALDAAVGLQQAASGVMADGTSERSRLRIGISIGDVNEAEGDVQGMPVVQAARLCDQAESDEILIADVVRILAGTRCAYPMSARSEIALKGFDEPVSCAVVEWSPTNTASSTNFPSSLAALSRGPFVGRAPVLDELLRAWRSRECRGVFVGGEPGIGKTRFLAELATDMRVDQVMVVLGRGDAELSVNYRAWIEALAPVVDVQSTEALDDMNAADLVELVRLLPRLVQRVHVTDDPVSLDPDARHAAVCDAVVELLRRSGPLMIVLDDVQWMDERSLLLVKRVLDEHLKHVMIAATFRDTEFDRSPGLVNLLADLRRIDGVRRLNFSGLDGDAVAEMFALTWRRDLTSDERSVASRVHSRTAGNPLYISELLHLLDEIQQGDDLSVTQVTFAMDGTLPLGLREVIERRLHDLDTDIERVLDVASAVDMVIDVGIVEDVIALDGPDVDVLGALETAQKAGIVIGNGRNFEFRHAVIRDVLTQSRSARRTELLHRKVVDVLERRWALSLDRHVEELAWHHDLARSPDAALWSLRAGESALNNLDARAVTFADRGLAQLDYALGDTDELRCDLLTVRAHGLRLTGVDTLAVAREAYEAALTLVDQRRIARALLSVGVDTAASRDGLAAMAFLEDGLTHLDDISLLGRWEVATACAVRRHFDPTTDPAGHIDEIAEIVAHLDPSAPESCQIAMRCARSLTSTNWANHALPLVELFGGNCKGVDTEGFPVEVAWSTMWLALGDRAKSDQLLDQAANDARRSYWFYSCQVLQRQTMRAMLDGHWDLADHLISEQETISAGDPGFGVSALMQRTWLRQELGDVENLHQELISFIDVFSEFPVARALAANVQTATDDLSGANEYLDECARDRFASIGRGWLTLLSVANVAMASIELSAERHHEVLLDLLSPYEGQVGVMVTGTHLMCLVDSLRAGLLALGGRDGDADALFSSSLAQIRMLRSTPLEARHRYWWGRSLEWRGDAVGAAAQYRAAREIASSLAMLNLVLCIDRAIEKPTRAPNAN